MRAAPLLLLLLAASCAPRAALKPLPEEPLALLEALRGQGLRASFALRGRDAQGRLYELTVAARASEAQGLSLRLYRTGLLVASLSPQDCSSAHPLFSPCGELLEALDRALRWWAVKEPRPPHPKGRTMAHKGRPGGAAPSGTKARRQADKTAGRAPEGALRGPEARAPAVSGENHPELQGGPGGASAQEVPSRPRSTATERMMSSPISSFLKRKPSRRALSHMVFMSLGRPLEYW